MCHFYANPLSVLLCCSEPPSESLQQEHFEAVRNLPSFRQAVEREVQKGTVASLEDARLLIEDNKHLLNRIRAGHGNRQSWAAQFLRSLLISQAAGVQRSSFSRAYVDGLVRAQLSSDDPGLAQSIRRMDPDELSGLLARIVSVLGEGDRSLGLLPSADERDAQLRASLESVMQELEHLKVRAKDAGTVLRSKYSGHSKVMRTTVVAQKVQLSQDTAALRDEDNRLTELVDKTTLLLCRHFLDTNPNSILFSECWLYETKSPSRDVFIPRPRMVFERSLGRPQDYLGCRCCESDHDGLEAKVPPTSLLYQLYLEAGNLVNVADLWTAFRALVSQGGEDERRTLVLFYRGLAEMRALGFVKASKKKIDHIAKIKWL
ncbi:hypothetical protein UVI_02039600 [Ustilaginoidea virens]|uniref:Origin recognition complex subunit 3 winged helix C-terminal domain-containing protein n=1 Tax=Ustilaginoidea virens TaxID=1159556 RepID=A0A1B5L0Q0_USTVR|nr:hypothetical protein UVI_02039600 [Ustilaginoidea virens]